ncbi:MAG: hypothetical protein RQ761_09225 [Bacteroidales bacterium]|nr:hypothetical protein [Bacteroidales bacterium]
METICNRCGDSFESDDMGIDLCPVCEIELSELENEESLEYEYDDTAGWEDDDF